MNLTTTEFRLKAEAVARGERPTTKAKSSSKVKVKPVPKAKPKATAPKVKVKPTTTRGQIAGRHDRPGTWVQAVTLIQKRDGCSASVAGRKACDEFPNLHPVQARRRKS